MCRPSRIKNRTRYGCLIGLSVLLALPGLASANALTSLDPRSMSMGGGGVAPMRPYNASHFNPARFAGNPRIEARQDDRPFGRFYFGARLIDRDGFLDSLDEFQESDNDDRFDDALDHLEERIEALDVSRDDFRAVTDAGNALLRDYESLSDKPLRAAASAGLNVGFPGDQWGAGAHVRQNLVVGMEIRFSEHDRRAIREALDFIDALLEISETGELPDDIVIPRPVDEFTSEFALRGAMVRDRGVSLAGRVPGHERTVVGVTVKSLFVETVDWRVDVESADSENFDFDEHRRSHVDVNLDLGLIRELDEHWSAALMVRNLIKRDYQTVLDNKISLRPVLRGGLSWQTPRWTVAVDMDINEIEAIGFDPAKRYTSLGMEYRPVRWLSLRGGYRYENVLQEGNVSLGFGFNSRHAHVDFAVSGDTGDSLGVALQAGARF